MSSDTAFAVLMQQRATTFMELMETWRTHPEDLLYLEKLVPEEDEGTARSR